MGYSKFAIHILNVLLIILIIILIVEILKIEMVNRLNHYRCCILNNCTRNQIIKIRNNFQYGH